MSTAQSPAAGDRRRVVLTGLGAITSIGTGLEEFTAGLRAGRSGAAPITRFDTTGFEQTYACEVKDFDAERWIRNVPLDHVGQAGQFAVAAARMAVEDAGLTEAELGDTRAVISIGTTDGESHDLDRLVAMDVEAGDPEVMDPVLAGRVNAGRLSTAVARELRMANVEATTVTTACAAGNYSIGYGLDTIRSGEADLAICGGADAVCRKAFVSFYRLGALTSEDRVRPFDVNRKGILTGEGAGMLVLESLDSALARGARIYAEVLGYGLSCDASHPTAPNREGIARGIELALDDAGVKKDEVDFISAHGTGTKANDKTESGAIVDVYGSAPPRTVALKSMLGHSMGAASALGAIACALSIEHGFIPPTINHVETDPECPVDCVPNESVEADVRIVQNNSSAFAGNNAILILGKYGERV
ncbi:beta-ketoacyl-[acyl-carrier-protein] synthase family protein [Streptomyces alfalfae]|uniref:3-oxoacyl-ACP synthase n=1 Tax=Streptomyces alfalfae TaxID=1642299 RepID=A0A1P8THL2_9ACTN|nr:beta-ketoacyl-[acyl-carrier-protein] synthase family protein [Streptomyces alfalfae]AYA17516.1 beta-ketoacyl-[acyl-carrier-protein] synthase family protein [Streptomyces fradiae]APY87117.1 3-oxoacyl-ACP synthase [Streptomyces alfalfae]QQC90617.1 beta-ketoacyl-[acyl-carrier-protein] synthase family protein [Streptomyces alfalfae]QUI33100.1 beta-ketoacyl-[acyl-carrier-protein] synthase family protein [Streptomyces alfalfae]RXX44558.1 beta-ketoacyl-[acyl-carrier-protein] synthase family protei